MILLSFRNDFPTTMKIMAHYSCKYLFGGMMKMKKLSLKWEKCPKEKLEKVVGGQSQAKTGKLTPKIAKCFFSFFKDCE